MFQQHTRQCLKIELHSFNCIESACTLQGVKISTIQEFHFHQFAEKYYSDCKSFISWQFFHSLSSQTTENVYSRNDFPKEKDQFYYLGTPGWPLLHDEKVCFNLQLIFLTSFAILIGKSCVTQTTISFRCKTSLTGCFIIARSTGTRILKPRK